MYLPTEANCNSRIQILLLSVLHVISFDFDTLTDEMSSKRLSMNQFQKFKVSIRFVNEPINMPLHIIWEVFLSQILNFIQSFNETMSFQLLLFILLNVKMILFSMINFIFKCIEHIIKDLKKKRRILKYKRKNKTCA